jgi:hypothetical protein
MLAVNYQTAFKFGIKDILSGSNTSTEGMKMPRNWNRFKFDAKNIKSINKGFEPNNKLKTMPICSLKTYLYAKYIKKVKWVSFLDYTDYRKDEAINTLVKEAAYKPYPYKHYESVFTRFYQGFILPKKFNVDKRKLHFSTLICTGQMTREEALRDLEKAPYIEGANEERDIEYFLKKMKWERADLETYINRPEKSHDCYPSEKKLWDLMQKIIEWKNKS